MANTPPEGLDWSLVRDDFLAAGSDDVPSADEATWSMSVSCSLSNSSRLLGRAPVAFTSRFSGREPMYDGTGEDIDDEATFGVEANDEARALLTWTDHWQAGLVATLIVYATREEFERGLSEAIECHRDYELEDVVEDGLEKYL